MHINLEIEADRIKHELELFRQNQVDAMLTKALHVEADEEYAKELNKELNGPKKQVDLD